MEMRILPLNSDSAANPYCQYQTQQVRHNCMDGTDWGSGRDIAGEIVSIPDICTSGGQNDMVTVAVGAGHRRE